MSDESIKSPSAPNTILDPSLDYWGDKIRVKFNGLNAVKIRSKKSRVNVFFFLCAY